jgi:pheromone shutdown-related protein TraB
MEPKENLDPIHQLTFEGKTIHLVGTAHVSKQSVDLVREIIADKRPDTVCVELCPSRFQALRQKERWQNMDIMKVIKEQKASLLLFNLIMSAFQKRIAAKLNIRPGQEMIQAIDSAEAIEAHVHLADRDVRTTLSRTLGQMSLWTKIKLIFQLLLSFGDVEEIQSEEVERLKQQDVLEAVLAEVGDSMPSIRRTLIDERDEYLAAKIRSAPGETIVAVVGAGHVPGIIRNWESDIDLAQLETQPPPKKYGRIIKWAIPIIIVCLLCYGFYMGGTRAGADMLFWWVAANGVLAGLGALLALAHPLTILSSIMAAPLTSLNPMIAAGWVSGLVEAFSRKPKVRDLEHLQDDILSIKGFWRNNVTRVLLVVVFTNIGSSVGTFVAFPLMMRALQVAA